MPDQEEGGGSLDERGSSRERHWQELLERRRQRDKELDRAAEEGGVGMVEDEMAGRLGILERMREGETAPQNPVHIRAQERDAEAAAIRSRAQRGIAILALAAAAVLAGLSLLGAKPYEVTAAFENASQLVGGEVVKVGGVQIGTVNAIELGDNGEALVTFHVNDEYAPLKRGTRATVRSFSLSGIANRQVQLTLPTEGEAGEEIADGGTMSQAETVSEVDLDQIFNTLDDETVADLKKVIKGFELSYEGVGKEANEGFRYLNPFLSSTRRLFAELSRDERALEQLIVDGAQVSGAVAERRDDVVSLVGNLNTTMGAIGRQADSLKSAVSQLPGFMRNFNTTAVNLRTALDDVDPLINASKPVAKELGPFFRQFRGAAANLVPTIADLDTVIKEPGSNNDLVDLTRLQTPLSEIAVGPVTRNGATRDGSFPETVRSLNDGLPQLSFFRAYTPELAGWFQDFGNSGIHDANGGIGRIATTFNTFSLSPQSNPIIDLFAGPPFGADTPADQLAKLSTNNTSRCPGSNERPAPDGSNPFTDGGAVDCDPTQIPIGP